VLAAIERVEATARAGRDREAYQSVRGDLLEMPRTIAVTRAEVAEAKVGLREQVRNVPGHEPSMANANVFAMAERIQDVAWTMRERGIDPHTCNEIETLAATILSASSLRDPNDHRAGKLRDVLQYLERRIDGMLEACAREAEREAARAQADDAQATQPEASAHPTGNGHDSSAHHNGTVERAPNGVAAAEMEGIVPVPFDQFGSDDPAAVTAALGIDDDATAAVAAWSVPTAEPSEVTASTAVVNDIALAPYAQAPASSETVKAGVSTGIEIAAVDVSAPPTSAAATEPGPAAASAMPELDVSKPSPPNEAPMAMVPVGGTEAAATAGHQPPRPATDTLATLRALSDAERIALFT